MPTQNLGHSPTMVTLAVIFNTVKNAVGFDNVSMLALKTNFRGYRNKILDIICTFVSYYYFVILFSPHVPFHPDSQVFIL